MSDDATTKPSRPLAGAIALLGRAVVAIGALAVVATILLGLASHAGAPSILIGIGAIVLLLACQWVCVRGASRSDANSLAWIVASYPLRILVILLSLYLPRQLGFDVRVPAIAAMSVLVAAMIAEVSILARTRVPNVDGPAAGPS